MLGILVGLLLIALLVRIFSTKSRPSSEASTADTPTTTRAPASPSHQPIHSVPLKRDSRLQQQRQTVGSEDCWIAPGQETTIAGRRIEGGMLYVGQGLQSVARHRKEPALIDPALAVATTNPAHNGGGMGYWPSYDTISPEDRAAYLEWLASGRRNPSTSIGYVFLFFYGLERRVLADSATSEAAARDLPVIRDEIHELLGVYGHNGSFRRYAGQLRDVLDASSPTIEPPMQRDSLEVPLAVRIMVGRFVEARTAVPVEWALSWYLTHPETYLRTPAHRCRTEFEALFRARFASRFPDGFVVKSTAKSSLKISFTPASASFGGTVERAFDVPDIAG